jgi:transposase
VYQRLLEQSLLPSVRPIFGENFIFPQDNCTVHRSHIVREYLEKHGINQLPWLSKSSDLNPIEDAWGKITKLMYQVFRPRNFDQLQLLSQACTDFNVCIKLTVFEQFRPPDYENDFGFALSRLVFSQIVFY